MADTQSQALMFRNRLTKNARKLRKWARKSGVTCYRVYDRDIPELPFAVDFYEGRLHLAEYGRPGSPEGAAHGPWVDTLAAAAGEALDVAERDIFVKRRERQRGKAQYERFGRAGAEFVVSEGGHKFLVNLSDYLDTGLFLDHRNLRARVQEESANKRVMNLFAYTGAFTVYAAAGGAAATTTVDMSNTYADWTLANLRLNGLLGANHRVKRADVLRFLEFEPPGYDLVVVDPPTFSNSKRMEGAFDVQRAHVALLTGVMKLVNAGGVVYFSTNFRRFKLDEGALSRLAEVNDMTSETVSDDFRNKRIHRTFRLVVR